MSKLIDVEKLDFVSYQGIPDGYKDSFDSGVLYAMNLIDDQPTADVAPIIRAKLLNPNPYGSCSHCNYLIDIREEFNYCPKCGAMLETNEVTK